MTCFQSFRQHNGTTQTPFFIRYATLFFVTTIRNAGFPVLSQSISLAILIRLYIPSHSFVKLEIIKDNVIMNTLPPRYWQQEGGDYFVFTCIFFSLCCGKYSCLLYLQMVGRERQSVTSLRVVRSTNQKDQRVAPLWSFDFVITLNTCIFAYSQYIICDWHFQVFPMIIFLYLHFVQYTC